MSWLPVSFIFGGFHLLYFYLLVSDKVQSAFVGKITYSHVGIWMGTSLGTIILLTADMLRTFPPISPEPPDHCTRIAT